MSLGARRGPEYSVQPLLRVGPLLCLPSSETSLRETHPPLEPVGARHLTLRPEFSSGHQDHQLVWLPLGRPPGMFLRLCCY